MSGDLTGKFNYSSLIRTLKDNGVQNATVAAKRVGRDNDIDNIKEIDGSEEIKIAQSIFDNAQTVEATNPFELQNQAAIFPFDNAYTEKLNAGKIMSDGDSVMQLPEIYNDDEYEVADYEDYYNFGDVAQNPITEGDVPESFHPADEIDDVKIKNMPYVPGEDDNVTVRELPGTFGQENDVKLRLLNSDYNKDTNDYKNDAELASGLYSAPITQKKDAESTDAAQSENEDVIKDDMMDMDMQNDSFNAK